MPKNEGIVVVPPDSNHGEINPAANREQTVGQREKVGSQREELLYPAKLTATERADIAAQDERLTRGNRPANAGCA